MHVRAACCVVVYFEGHPRKTSPQASTSVECTDRRPWVCVCVCVVLDSLWQMSSLWLPQAVRINIAEDKKSRYLVGARRFH